MPLTPQQTATIMARATVTNQANIKNLPDGGITAYLQVGGCVFIGPNHNFTDIQSALDPFHEYYGWVQVEKSSLTILPPNYSVGVIHAPENAADRGTFDAAVAAFSAKGVEYDMPEGTWRTRETRPIAPNPAFQFDTVPMPLPDQCPYQPEE